MPARLESTAVAYESMAEDALLLRFGEIIDPGTSARVHAAARRLSAHWPELECVPAYASLLLRFNPGRWQAGDGRAPHDLLIEAIRDLLNNLGAAVSDTATRHIPVHYGGSDGADLLDVAKLTGLSPAAVIARHCAVDYRVAMLGFAPGFPYLLGLDPALAVPRRKDPRQRVPAGSVAIGGQQTGIYPAELPGGWQLIGRTPLALFDPRIEPPARLQAGDTVRFQAIDEAAFAQLSAAPPA